MGVVKTASESILEETVMPSEEANYSQQGYAGHPVIRSLLPSVSDRLRHRNSYYSLYALKAMWQAAHPRATANRCLEIQIYRLRCSRAPTSPRKSDLCCNVRLSNTDLKSQFM
ncbi:hypothetical protein ALC60_00878 [Trachymyrmex zeteki]|uniref:Uncharacterized protein n=1 Tax=Mycetomoellerius zeteki TaxID=64791 RepID=A0A151XIB1_9HYME|nr:hypothetical protein ALC60_00878 [Trachymyrmex zeteki]